MLVMSVSFDIACWMLVLFIMVLNLRLLIFFSLSPSKTYVLIRKNRRNPTREGVYRINT